MERIEIEREIAESRDAAERYLQQLRTLTRDGYYSTDESDEIIEVRSLWTAESEKCRAATRKLMRLLHDRSQQVRLAAR